LFYGDDWRDVSPEDMILDLERGLGAAAAVAGSERRDLLTRLLVLAGELSQGLADADLAAQGFDGPTQAQDAAMRLTVAAARLLLQTDGGATLDASGALAALSEVRSMRLPPSLRCKTPEGYAFYAVDPESYAKAAAAFRWDGEPLAIGVRSIGTSLAAVVSARVGGRAVTVRPSGHPFRRELRPSPALRALLADHDGPFVIVDEGPGLSGSSFGAVADLLESLDVKSGRIVFMPSHAGDLGPHAAAAHRTRWARATRLTADLAVSDRAVEAWFADVIGPAADVEDLGGGAWRDGPPGHGRPPAAPTMERRKYRLTTGAGRYIARFAGLGTVGERKLEIARLLHAAGFAPEPLALRRGFLLERWVEGERLDAGAGGRPEVLAQVARYLGWRARALPAPERRGASLAALREMAAHNASELGGGRLRARSRRGWRASKGWRAWRRSGSTGGCIPGSGSAVGTGGSARPTRWTMRKGTTWSARRTSPGTWPAPPWSSGFRRGRPRT
jgi:hypothetical protein